MFYPNENDKLVSCIFHEIWFEVMMGAFWLTVSLSCFLGRGLVLRYRCWCLFCLGARFSCTTLSRGLGWNFCGAPVKEELTEERKKDLLQTKGNWELRFQQPANRILIVSRDASCFLSAWNDRLVFHVLSAATHIYPERQSSGAYTWVNNVPAWGSRLTRGWAEGDGDTSHWLLAPLTFLSVRLRERPQPTALTCRAGQRQLSDVLSYQLHPGAGKDRHDLANFLK